MRCRRVKSGSDDSRTDRGGRRCAPTNPPAPALNHRLHGTAPSGPGSGFSRSADCDLADADLPGHHLIELTDTLEISQFKLVHKKVKLISLEETGMSAKIEKTKKDGKLHYNLLKVYK